VEVRLSGAHWQLYVNRSRFTSKGAGLEFGDLDKLAERAEIPFAPGARTTAAKPGVKSWMPPRSAD